MYTDLIQSRTIDDYMVVELFVPPQSIEAANQNDGMTYRTEGAQLTLHVPVIA